ncbi:xyloglucan galactosyltransferase MUR3 [Marchantia polymorpha subsp. ruderalis]|uniref:Exostosin GT47 domain-containing protein n=2 Tax=Marchantia polymorpha TaxID=3197 RepID=A0AAF6BXP2_MARPO|nr:hypothetical protein MARPO_0068s0073 [Marchantia polymorpha]BBN16776.1 hypothetical protein Mp_7g09200 [Marchantia polymorpha subsp. ruderalis]|eukprot:PTQ35859.1 hypothetical protein MARPO_0068s0073 [Marchantia polymorpha]
MTSKKQLRVRMEKVGLMSRLRTRCILVAVSVAFGWLLFVFHFVSVGRTPESNANTQVNLPFLAWQQRESLRSSFLPSPEKFASRDTLSEAEAQTFTDTGSLEVGQVDISSQEADCRGKYLYLYELPKMFNERLLEGCEGLTMWADMCKETVNQGFGPPMEDPDGVFQGPAWYATNQFMLELIFHDRIRKHKCLTQDSSKANALFVPFYGGLDVMPHLWDGANITERDSVPKALEKWLMNRPEWKRLDGHDHFMTGGRITWDFRRRTEQESDWGNKLLLLPGIVNLTTLIIEASPWHPNDYAVPYPTYFHPSTDEQVLSWQDFVRKAKRPSLFCFAGAPRPEIDASIRSQLMSHCDKSEYCNLLACGKSHGKCHSPSNVMKLFKESVFCLQPQGDSFTRRSIFDSMLAGCIPVFFHVFTAYTQYGWHLPDDHSTYSVFIHEDNVRAGNVSVEQVLRNIPPEQVQRMRETVISLIPKIVYAQPNNKMTLKDGFDTAIEGVLGRITDYKKSLGASVAVKHQQPENKDVLTTEDIWRKDQAEKEAQRMKLEQAKSEQLSRLSDSNTQ